MYYTIKKIKQKRDLLFRTVETNVLNTRSMVFPDFLIIGAQKGGTTWLYEVLNEFDNVYFPSLEGKHDPTEVRYFDERLFNPLKWYSDLYKGNENKIKGDKTPKYYLISREKIKLIHALMPHVKILFILRNPIDRAWSQAVMNLKRFDKIELDGNKNLYIKFLRDNLKKGYYSQYIENWLSVFPSEQFKILLYDDLKRDPHSFLQEVASFLELGPIEPMSIDLDKKINNNPKIEMPGDIYDMLHKEFHDEIVLLHDTFGLDVGHWLETQYTR